jgi:hypothetical protein
MRADRFIYWRCTLNGMDVIALRRINIQTQQRLRNALYIRDGEHSLSVAVNTRSPLSRGPAIAPGLVRYNIKPNGQEDHI